ncbi:hypothetical protein BTJ39_06640 [Izhakiella australiensis]|uniref:Uncharacterized protein n=1 Tax=Izhakiella australiensis TaxID=1926881 RepID=A0A1S8YQ09_9GAMM|nr:hypothetical protein BTJ39_06640 [Izhakiella australiensis]
MLISSPGHRRWRNLGTAEKFQWCRSWVGSNREKDSETKNNHRKKPPEGGHDIAYTALFLFGFYNR